LVNDEEFSAIVVMVLITTLVTPPILRALFMKKEDKAKKNPIEAEHAPASIEAKELEES